MATVECTRPSMTSEDVITPNCTEGSRDNYYRLPLLLASMAPSGPIPWEIADIVESLPDLSAVCDESYDPAQTGELVSDLNALFRDAGFGSLLDSEACFDTAKNYTVAPIDPISDLTVTDLALYNWQENFDFSQNYYRPGSGGGGGAGVHVFSVTEGLTPGIGVTVNKFDHYVAATKSYYFECSQPGEDGILMDTDEVSGLFGEVLVPPYTEEVLGFDYPAEPKNRVVKLNLAASGERPLYILDTVPDVGSGLATAHLMPLVPGGSGGPVVPVMVPIIYHRFAPTPEE